MFLWPTNDIPTNPWYFFLYYPHNRTISFFVTSLSSQPHLKDFFFIKKKHLKKREKKNTELIKQVFATKDRCLCFHNESFFFILSMIGFHVSIFLGLDPMGISKYTKGIDGTLQFKYLAYLAITFESTPIPLVNGVTWWST